MDRCFDFIQIKGQITDSEIMANNNKSLHHFTMKWRFGFIKLVQPCHFLLKYLHQARNVYVVGISILPHPTIVLVYFGIVLTFWYFLLFILFTIKFFTSSYSLEDFYLLVLSFSKYEYEYETYLYPVQRIYCI